MNKQNKRNKIESTKQPKKGQSLCQVETDVRPKPNKTYKRLLNIIIERTQQVSEVFVWEIPHALRELADAIEKEEICKSDIGKFYSSNRCVIKIIHGSHDLYPDEIRDEQDCNNNQK